jgi:hypothetical protein
VAGLGCFGIFRFYLMFVTILLCFGLEIATERQALERYPAINSPSQSSNLEWYYKPLVLLLCCWLLFLLG